MKPRTDYTAEQRRNGVSCREGGGKEIKRSFGSDKIVTSCSGIMACLSTYNCESLQNYFRNSSSHTQKFIPILKIMSIFWAGMYVLLESCQLCRDVVF